MSTPFPLFAQDARRTLRPSASIGGDYDEDSGDTERIRGPVDDDELMARTAAGDEEAFRQLVERWERPIHSFLSRMLGSGEEALDLSQETFLRVYRESARYKAAGRFRSWLFRIAGNLARSRLRRRKILRWMRFDPSTHDLPSPDPGAETGHLRRETQRAVRSALGQLPDRQREAIVLRRYQELSYQEIAQAMDTTVPAVESLIQRGMAALRRDLADKGVTP